MAENQIKGRILVLEGICNSPNKTNAEKNEARFELEMQKNYLKHPKIIKIKGGVKVA